MSLVDILDHLFPFISIHDVAKLHLSCRKCQKKIEKSKNWLATYDNLFPYDLARVEPSGFIDFYARYCASVWVWGSSTQWDDFKLSNLGVDSQVLYDDGDQDILEEKLEEGEWEYKLCKPKHVEIVDEHAISQVGVHFLNKASNEFFVRINELAGSLDVYKVENGDVKAVTERGPNAKRATPSAAGLTRISTDWIDRPINFDRLTWVFDFEFKVRKYWKFHHQYYFFVESLGLIRAERYLPLMNVFQVQEYKLVYSISNAQDIEAVPFEYSLGFVVIDIDDGSHFIMLDNPDDRMLSKVPFKTKGGWKSFDNLAKISLSGDLSSFSSLHYYTFTYSLHMDIGIGNLQVYSEADPTQTSFNYKGFLGVKKDGSVYFVEAPTLVQSRIPGLENIVQLETVASSSAFVALSKDGRVYAGGTSGEGVLGLGVLVDVDCDTFPPTNNQAGTFSYLCSHPNLIKQEEKAKVSEIPFIIVPRHVQLPGRAVRIASNENAFSVIVM